MTLPLKPLLIQILVLCALIITATPVLACSAFLLTSDNDQIAVAKSYDWHMGQGMLLTNKRGLKKSAVILDPNQRGHQWTSKYGNVTFNQYGAEFPNGGMNEAGLVLEVLWLDQSQFPSPDARPALTELQWIQWALDTQNSIADLIKATKSVRVMSVYAKVHYFGCDARGQCATFEHIDGKLEIHHGSKLPVPALTNHSYRKSIDYFNQQNGALPKGDSSLARFVRAGSSTPTQDLAKTGFSKLADVNINNYTKWNIVYLPSSKQIQFRTSSQMNVKYLSLSSLQFGCQEVARMLDVQSSQAGDVAAEFKPLTLQDNSRLVSRSLKSITSKLPSGTVELLSAYPFTLACR